MILVASMKQGERGDSTNRVPTSGLAHSSRALPDSRRSPTAGSMRPITNLFLLTFLLVLLAAPGAAFASSQDVIKDCSEDGTIDGNYSRHELEQAENDLPSDIDEYTDCREAIRSAQEGRGGGPHVAGVNASGGGTGGSNGSGGAGNVTPTADDTAELDRITKAAHGDRAPELTVRGQRIAPGSGGLYTAAGAANELPLSLMLIVIAVATTALTGGYLVLRRRFPGAFGAAVRLFRR